MSARGGRRNGIYAPALGRLVHPCPKPECQAAPGRRCVKKVGDQWLPMVNTHAERKAMRGKR